MVLRICNLFFPLWLFRLLFLLLLLIIFLHYFFIKLV